jgi:TatD DNase family protein
MMANFYDTHFHFDLQEPRGEILKEIENKEIYTIAVTNLPPLYEKLNNEVNSKFIKVALGFHPELIGQYQKYIPEMWRLLPNVKYIGEVGIDLKVGKETKSLQISFFEELIAKCNILGNKIISIHSRAAIQEVIAIVGKNINSKIILHWYSGTRQNQKQAIDNGYYFSVNYAMLSSDSGRKIVANIPNDKILIETDSPFIQIDKQISRSYNIDKIVEGIAKIKGEEINNMQNILWDNFLNIISTNESLPKIQQ